MKINKDIFREYDIRGVYPSDINEDLAYLIGKAFGSYIKRFNQEKCIIGYDNRHSSVALSTSLKQGILETGTDVIDLGLVTSPMYYYSRIYEKTCAGIMVTASHNPKDDNGFKMSFNELGNARGNMIEDFYGFMIKGDFNQGEGQLSFCNIEPAYIDLIKKSLSFGSKKLRVVVDCGNGTTSIIAKKLYNMFPIDCIMIFDESDSNFPNHHPDPSVSSNLTKLIDKVLEEKADCGVAFDGDGDRVGIVDDKGNIIETDKFMIIMARDILPTANDKHILYDVKCGMALKEQIELYGGIPYCSRTGYSYTSSKVVDENWSFGGELSGHVYFNDRFENIGCGLYAGLRFLELLSKTNKKASELLDDVPDYFSTEELKFPSTETLKREVVGKIKNYAIEKQYKILDIDGVRVDFEDSWALVRFSNTGPNITARFEAKTENRLRDIKEEFINLINEYNKI